MPSGDGRWAELSSHNERVIRPGDPEVSSARAHAQWAELDSSGERLVDATDPLLAVAAGRETMGMRLVPGAA
jgi:hypothetical protein